MSKNKYKQGTKVRITNPEFFVRCGYPETVESAKEKLEQAFVEKHGRSIKHVLDDLFNFNDNPSLKLEYGDLNFGGNFFKEWEEDKIIGIAARAYNRNVLGFGGNERKLYTKRIPKLEGKIMYIGEFERPLIKKTGTYVKGSGGYYDYWGDYDYDPSYLDNVKTHTFYPVSDNTCMALTSFKLNTELDAYTNWIEKTNFEIIED